MPAAGTMTNHTVLHIAQDIRAMRKVNDGELVAIINNEVLDGTTFAMNVQAMIRCLFLLP